MAAQEFRHLIQRQGESVAETVGENLPSGIWKGCSKPRHARYTSLRPVVRRPPDAARSEPVLNHEESEPGPSDEPDQGVEDDSSSVPLQEADRDGPPDEGDRENDCPENEDQENEILDDGASEEANCNGEYGEPIGTQ